MNMLSDLLITELKSLIQDEEQKIWEIGDLLVKNPLTDAELQKVAQEVNRKPSTLKDRRKVSNEFPIGTWNRKEFPSWGIYKELARIVDHEERLQVLRSRPPEEWTVQAMKTDVDRRLLQKSTRRGTDGRIERIGLPNIQRSTGMNVGGVIVRGFLHPNNTLELTIDHPILDESVECKDFDDQYRISVKLNTDRYSNS